MKTSEFQFSNPALSELEFYINEYDTQDEDISVALGMTVNKERVSETEAVVELTVEIGQKDNSAPFYIKASEGAIFKWEEGAFDKDQDIEDLLDINAPSLLISYLRPIIANITNASKYPAYNLPFINFNDVKRNN